MNGRHVLLVDDDAALLRVLTITLRAHGWRVSTATTGAGALHATARESPDVVVLDLGLPDIDGLTVLAHLRQTSEVPVVVLSARRGREDKVDTLDAGADDYVTKPFAADELMARLRAAVRRAAPTDETDLFVESGDLRVDLARKRVHRGGLEVRLTPTEWSFLEVLARHRGAVVPPQEILAQVWGPAYTTEVNYLRVYAAQLRRKLEDDSSRPVHLLTRPGQGYLFE
ncbi:response regulator [Actinotalea sp. Marseille-Q4924]|uniref:response regulator n=1 Tax=Actinotalea sp. Marseille-Q4924 TaxID=2866571 RepID=UPI001CE3FAFB|nr:response regulator transcription factor [Actinotalea sp. Marseille-Q4924]